MSHSFPGAKPVNPSYFMALCFRPRCFFLLDCLLLSLLQNFDVTFRTLQDATSPQSLPRWPPETPLMAQHGLLCIFSTVFRSLLFLQKTCADLGKEFKAFHKRKAFAANEKFIVLIASTRVQAGKRSPTQMVLGI